MEPAPIIKRRPGRPRKIPLEIDPNQPLHPWASQSTKLVTSASPSTSYRPPQKPKQYVDPMHAPQPPSAAPAAAAPISTSSFYAQPAASYTRATPVPAPAPAPVARSTPAPAQVQQFLVPVAAPRMNIPTRADLDFLLGGSAARLRARSSTPNAAAVQARAASVAPVGAASRRSYPVAQVAGPSKASAVYQHAVAPRTAAVAPPQDDDELPLGAEAVPESDHHADDSRSFDSLSDLSDDPENDPNFRPNSAPRHALTHSASLKRQIASVLTGGDPYSSTPPPDRERRRYTRRSLESSSGKVPGSTSPSSMPRKRGRPPKEDYTPDVMEKIKAANEILAMAADPAAHGFQGGKKPRLDEIIDRKTRQALSPEMQQAILRARNTQLQRERRERLKAQAEAEGGGVRVRKKYERRNRREEDEGSGIVERARGKVSEWIKNVSSEAEGSVEPEKGVRDGDEGEEEGPRRVGRQPVSNVRSSPGKVNIDPRLQGEGDGEGEGGKVDEDDAAVEGYFSRFGTVTGKHSTDTPAKGEAEAAQTGEPKKPAEGVPGDEYYFST